MRGIDIKRRILTAYENGFTPEQVINGQWNPTFPIKNTRPRFFVAQFFRPILTTTAPTNPTPAPNLNPINRSNDKPKEDSPIKESISSAKPSLMDIDIAKKRMAVLKKLATDHKADYITNSLPYHSRKSPSTKALRLERRIFYQLFGREEKTRELMALFIANLTSSGNPQGPTVINGLIKYFERLADLINENSQILFHQPNLLEKYLDYGSHEVYKLIKSIAAKITTTVQNIQNENLFPKVSKTIQDVFGNLKPIEF